MSKSPETLEQRRVRLIKRCAEQRRILASHTQDAKHATSKFDVMFQRVRSIKEHPGWIFAFFVGIALIKPQRLNAVAKTAVATFRTWNKVAPLVEALNQRRQQALH